MNVSTKIDRRAYRHEAVDGLSEIAMALFFLVPALTVREPAFGWLIILPVLFMGPWLKKLRARHTWPRIGSVEPRREDSGRLFREMAVYTAVVVLVVGAGVFIVRGEITPGLVRRVSPLLASLLFGGGLLYAAERSGLRRYHVLLGLSLVLGTTFTFIQFPGRYSSLQFYLLGMGAITFIVGSVTFIRFIRTHPVRDLEEVDRVG